MRGSHNSEAHQRIGRAHGFSLIELVIVVVIIGIIGAIAIPRISRGASGASDSALTANLAVLRNAIDLYATEHGGKYPTLADITDQLTKYTDSAGGVSATKDATHIYGPYLRAIPPLPVGNADVKGSTGFTATANEAGKGWFYDADKGEVLANSEDKDASGKAYNTY